MATHFFVGNLVDVPLFRVSETGVATLRLSLAVNESYRDDNGQWKDHDPVFWDAYAWRNTAEAIAQYGFTKGQNVIIEARIAAHRWTDEAGKTHSRTTLHILNIGPNITRTPRAAQPTVTTGDTGWNTQPHAGLPYPQQGFVDAESSVGL